MTTALFCPLDGLRMATEHDHDDPETVYARCATHRWQFTVDLHADTPDGWSVFGLQCDNNNDSALLSRL